MRILTKILITSLSLLAVAEFLPGVAVASFYIALIVALLLGAVNLFVKPILVILTLPLNILSLGLFSFVINGLLLWFISTFVDGFDIDTFWTAFIAALIVSFFKWLADALTDRD